MLADIVEGAVRSLGEVTLTRIEAVIHNMAMKRLQDGQFDECDLTLDPIIDPLGAQQATPPVKNDDTRPDAPVAVKQAASRLRRTLCQVE